MSRPLNALAFRPLIYSALALVCVAVGAIAFTIWGLRSDALEQAERETSKLATLLSDKAEQLVRSADLLLAEIQEKAGSVPLGTSGDLQPALESQAIYLLLRERLSRLPQGEVIELLDPNGDIINSSRSWPPRRHNAIDHAQLLGLREAPRDQVAVFKSAGEQLRFMRGLYGGGGNLVGFVSLSLSARRFHDSAVLSQGQAFSLRHADGTLLFQHPPAEAGFDARTVLDREGADRWGSINEQKGGGEYWLATRPLRAYPLTVTVGLAKDLALNSWERRATYISGGTLIALLCSVFLIKALFSHLYQLLRSEKALSAQKATLAEKSQELERMNEKLDAALNNMSQGLCMFDKDERLVVCNDRYLDLYGLASEQMKPGATLREVLELKKRSGTEQGLDIDEFLQELRIWRSKRTSAHLNVPLSDGRIISVCRQPVLGGGWISTHEDVTEQRRSEARIAHMARHDSLTDLANRVLFKESMDKALGRLRRTGEGFCILVLDLDLFKTVNDSLGHPVGDALLRAVSQQLRGLVRETDTVARLGGDEFAILQTCTEREMPSAIALAGRILAALGETYEIDGHQITIGASIGIAIAPDHGNDAGQLLKNADLALYRAKSDGRNCYRFFESGMDVEAQARRELEVDLRNAIARGEFELHYQTVVEISTQQICGLEALVRWVHPTRGLISPDQFIPLAEEIGLVIPIGEWILQKACMDACRWPSSIRLAVNLSPVQFRNGNLVEIVSRALTLSGLPAERLELEITETVLLQKSQNNIAILHRLKQLGVGIVLDDFGTGYSSLSYLQMFPFSKIKIDRSFVADVATRADSAAIVCAIAGLGRSLNIDTTAEGVETSDQLKLLRAAGCTHAQGYLFSRPCSLSEIEFTKPAKPKRMRAAGR